MKYRKKPVVIEAVEVIGTSYEIPLEQFFSEYPGWLTQALEDKVVRRFPGTSYFEIKTLEGEMRADPGDFIIKGVKDELYPCKADIFTLTYDKVDET